MSEDNVSQAAEDLTEEGSNQAVAGQASATEMLSSAAGYIKEHPWTAAVGVATVLGATALALGMRAKPKPATALEAMRGWVDEARAKLPTRRDVDKAAQRMGVTDFIRMAGQRLHLLPAR